MRADKRCGHAAGKTTAVGMLTGLLRPTGGSCSVMGHDVHSAAAHARQHIGYCPQANVLFGTLTVWEHLLLFCAIKGLSSGAFGPAAAAASQDIMQARTCNLLILNTSLRTGAEFLRYRAQYSASFPAACAQL